jgi:hypothetical protein
MPLRSCRPGRCLYHGIYFLSVPLQLITFAPLAKTLKPLRRVIAPGVAELAQEIRLSLALNAGATVLVVALVVLADLGIGPEVLMERLVAAAAMTHSAIASDVWG